MNLHLPLEGPYEERLTSRAAEEGVGAEEYARRIVLRALEANPEGATSEVGKALSELRRELSGIRLVLSQVQSNIREEIIRDIENLRSDFSIAVLALLVGAGQVEKEEAREWVKKNLRPLL